MFEVFAHAVVFNGEESRVEDDAEGHGHVEEGVVDKGQQAVLELDPTLVGARQAAHGAETTVAVTF